MYYHLERLYRGETLRSQMMYTMDSYAIVRDVYELNRSANASQTSNHLRSAAAYYIDVVYGWTLSNIL